MIKVLIADDHALIRKGMQLILESTRDIRIVAEAEDCQQTLEEARAHPVDVVILDLMMPGRGGIDIIRELKKEHPRIKVIVLTIYEARQYAVQCIRNGADAFLNKFNAEKHLIPAIRTIATDKPYITEEVACCLAQYVDDKNPRAGFEQLSVRELQVLIRLGMGATNKQVAQELNLSDKTVSTYRTRLMKKLNLSTNADLVRYMMENSLLP